MTFKGGPGHSATVYAYSWNCHGKKGFCIDFGRHNPDGDGTTTLLTTAPGMTAAETKRAEWISANYSTSADKSVVANAALAMWKLRNDKDFNTWYSWARSHNVITLARHNAVLSMLAASNNHGPYTMTVKVTPVHVGQAGTGTAVVKAANGKLAPGISIKVTSSSNIKVTSVNGVAGVSGKTNSKGAISFKFTKLNTGTATFTATGTGAEYRSAMLTTPSLGRQRVLIGRMYTFKATASFNKSLGRPTMVATCDTNCEGIATVKFTATNPTGSKMVKWTWRVTGTAVASLYVSGGTTGSKSVKLMDGDMVSAEYCYVNTAGGACVTPTVKLSGTQEVVCPGWVKLAFTGDCPCEGGVNFVFTLTSPASSSRTYQAQVIKNGSVVQTIDLVNGVATTTKPVALGSGDRLRVQFTAYRDATMNTELRTGALFDMSNNL